MSNEQRPRKVKAKITRYVTEIAICWLDNDGSVMEIEHTDELDFDVTELEIQEVLVSW